MKMKRETHQSRKRNSHLIIAQKIITPVPYKLEKKKVMLRNGWSLSPADRSLPLGDLPLNIAVSSSEKLVAVTNNG